MATINAIDDEESGSVTIKIRGRFDFSAHQEFREAYKTRPGMMLFNVNMLEVEYIDSSALGMLLLLREHVLSEGGSVVITECAKDIARILKIANFDKLFSIK